jgi:hypothetical protein
MGSDQGSGFPAAGRSTPGFLDPEVIVNSYSFIPLVIIMFRKKDGGISAVAKKHSAIGTFF